MVDLPAEFDLPAGGGTEVSNISGYFEVLEWGRVRVIINRVINVGDLLDIQIHLTDNFGSGSADIKIGIKDKDITVFNYIGNEIEIYLNDTEGVLNKKFGGYIDDIKFVDESRKDIMSIHAKEYSSRLLRQKYDGEYTVAAGELSDCIASIMDQQGDFTYENVEATTGKSVSYTSTDEELFTIMKKLADQWGYTFRIGIGNRDLYMFPTAQVTVSSDTIIDNDNVLHGASYDKNAEFIINDYKVNSSDVVSGTSSDAASQLLYGIYSRTDTITGFDANGDATQYAESTIDKKSSPLSSNVFETTYLPSVIPTEYINVNAPSRGLVGQYYVVEVGHRWSAFDGWRSRVKLGDKLEDITIVTGRILNRLRAAEQMAFVGV